MIATKAIRADELLLTTEALAERLDVTTRTVQNWRHAGRIPYIKLSPRCFRYSLEQVIRSLAK